MKLNDITLPTELSPRALAGICITIACIAVITLFYAGWQWRQDWSLTHQPLAVSALPPSAPSNVLATITQQHLFGQSARDMPITNLQLQVTGIVKMDTARSKAYISMSGQPSKIYMLGDILPYGVKVYDIQPNAVVLQTDEGQLEKLPLPRAALKFKSKSHEERYRG